MEIEQQTATPEQSAPPPEVAAAVEQAETQEQSESQEQVKPSNGYEGSNFVEFTPEQQKRLNTLAKKAGNAEREAAELRSLAKEQFDLINELRTGQQQIVTHLQTSNFADVEKNLIAQKQEALERGDGLAYDKLTNDLVDLRVQKALAAKEPKPQIQQRQIPQGDFVEAAVQKGAISRDDAEVYRQWETETDLNGNPVRSWTNERDPRNQSAALLGKAVFLDPSFKYKPFAEKLKEIDRRMGVTTQNRMGSGVLPSGNLTGNSKSGNVKLSPNQERIAVQTKFAGPGKSSLDHIEAYRKQVAEVRGTRK